MKRLNFYPIFLNLEGKKCVVIGGGQVAERKVFSLLGVGAKIYVVSPQITSRLKNLHKKGKIFYLPFSYRRSFLKGAFLVIAATNEPEVNLKISQEACRLGLLVNSVDAPGEGNFILPAVLRRRGVILAISTEGRAPLLAKKMKEDFSKIITQYAKHLDFIESLRKRLKEKYPHQERIKILRKIAKMPLFKIKSSRLVKNIFK